MTETGTPETLPAMSPAPAPAPPAERKPFATRLFGFLKEWGSVITLCIALVYTYPSGFIESFFNRAERREAAQARQIADVRQAISEMATLRAQKMSDQIKSQEPRYQDALNSVYDIRIYNIIYTRKDDFRKWAHRLRSTETYAIGSSLSLIGEINDSLYYYDLAFEQAKAENNPSAQISALRERGATLFAAGTPDALKRARQDFRDALTMLKALRADWAKYRIIVMTSELASFELASGDWACGQVLGAISEKLYQASLSGGDLSLSAYHQMFQQNVAFYKRKPGQPADGCGYTLPG